MATGSFTYQTKKEVVDSLTTAYGFRDLTNTYMNNDFKRLFEFFKDSAPEEYLNGLENERAAFEAANHTDEEKARFESAMTKKKEDYGTAMYYQQHHDRISNVLMTYKSVQDHIRTHPEDTEANQSLAKDYEMLYSLSEFNQQYRDADGGNVFNEHDGENVARLQLGADKKLRYIMKNLNGTGLNFSIENGRTIVISDTNQVTPQQIKELARFFYMNGLGDEGDFNFNNIKDLEIVPDAEHPQEKTFDDIFNRGLNDAFQKDDIPLGGEEILNDFKKQQNNENVLEGASPEEVKRYKNSVSAMADKVRFRLGIMNFTKPQLITTRRCLDGSIVICAYTDEASMRHDSESKNGDVTRKKAFAVKIGYHRSKKNGQVMPFAQYYVPEGKPVETSQIQCALEALKCQGCEYFFLPSANETSGKGQGAIWEAVGKTLMVPLCQTAETPNGTDLANEHVDAILEQIKKEKKHASSVVIAFKKKLLAELREQEDYKREKHDKPIIAEFEKNYNHNEMYKRYGEAFEDMIAAGEQEDRSKEGFKAFAKKQYLIDNGGYQTNSLLNTQMSLIEGSIAYDDFKSKFLPDLNDYITAGIQGKYGEKWSAVDAIAAYRTLGDIISNYHDDSRFPKFPKDPARQKAQLKVALFKGIEQQKKKAVQDIVTQKDTSIDNIHTIKGVEARIDPDRIRKEAVKAVQKEVRDYMKSVTDSMNDQWGVDIKANVIDAPTYLEARYMITNKDTGRSVAKEQLPPTSGVTERLRKNVRNAPVAAIKRIQQTQRA